LTDHQVTGLADAHDQVQAYRLRYGVDDA
jgi:hypothetical protein